MAFFCVSFALLISQSAAASIVRNHAATGEVDFSIAADATAQSVLAQVEQLAQAHSKVSKPKIQTIQDLVHKLEESLEATRQGSQKEVDRNLEAVKKCNRDQAKSIKEITETTKVTVGKERVAHAECRTKEMKTHADMIAKCTALKDFLKQLEGPAEAGSDDDAMVDYVVAMDTYWCPKGPIAKDKSKKCNQAKDKHKAEKEKCDELQSQFELGFCTWRTELLDVCDAQTTCYKDAVETYKQHKAETEALVKKWKTECVALKKISCYVKVWLNDGNEKTVDAEQLEECRLLNPECASKCHINFKEPADKAVCSLADVEHYPGTDEFKNTEYAQFLDAKQKFGDDELYHFIKEPTKCVGDETTAAPTVTEAPQKSGVEYYAMKKGDAGCPENEIIESHEECEDAHRALNFKISPKWTGNYNRIPGACSTRQYKWGGGHYFHWNNLKVGVSRGDLTPICKKAANTCDAQTGPAKGMCPVAMCMAAPAHCRYATSEETPWVKRGDSCCQKLCYMLDKKTGEVCDPNAWTCDPKTGPERGHGGHGRCPMAMCHMGPDMQHCRFATSSETPWIKGKDSCCQKQCLFLDKETGEPCKPKKPKVEVKTVVKKAFVVTSKDQAAKMCQQECKAQKYCCNDWKTGSNQMISCAQACMIRALGTPASKCTGLCARNGGSGCSLTENGQRYSFCQRCSDLDNTCPHGVQSPKACEDGCAIDIKMVKLR